MGLKGNQEENHILSFFVGGLLKQIHTHLRKDVVFLNHRKREWCCKVSKLRFGCLRRCIHSRCASFFANWVKYNILETKWKHLANLHANKHDFPVKPNKRYCMVSTMVSFVLRADFVHPHYHWKMQKQETP